MTEPVHVDENGQPCTRHELASMTGIFQLAALGARMASFNHDIASKVQGLMMALDEIGEIAPGLGDPDLARASETAMQALKELHALLSQNRALTKPPVKSKIALAELMRVAAARAGVGLRGTVTGDVEVAVPMTTQALALLIDAAGGTGRGRSLEIAQHDRRVVLAAATPAPANAAESVALAAWILRRDGGALWCRADGSIAIELPLV